MGEKDGLQQIGLPKGRRASVSVDQRGVAMVLVAIVLPVVLAFGSLVITVGNWYVHKKHLQTQVDAGAFAGATKFVGCSFQFGDPVAANAAIRASALEYAGDSLRPPSSMDPTFTAPVRNLQVQQPDDVRVVLNSAAYWKSGDPTNGTGLDNTLDPDNDPLTPGDPCSTQTLDVKATDDEAPTLWGWLPFVASPKSKARVEIRQIKEQNGMLPFAVPEIDPAAVAAIFVNEDTGAVIDWQLLMKTDLPSLPFSEWVTPEPWTCPELTPGCIALGSENTGVVILVSKEDDTPILTTGGAGTLTTICTQAPNLVRCYAGDGNQDGITFIHGWSDTLGAPATPQIRDVTLSGLTCTDDLSRPYFLLTGDCDVGATAVIDFGVAGNPVPNQPAGIEARVKLSAPGCTGGGGCPMTWQSTNGTESTWTTTTKNAFLGAASGRASFSISWNTTLADGTGRSGTFTGVAHPYVANDASGPIEYLKLTTADVGIPDANSRNKAPVSVIVTVGLNKPFEIVDALDPPILLRIASRSGSLNQALDCDANAGGTYNLDDEIANGCQTTYGLNYDDWDKNKSTPKTWADITCSAYGVNDLPPPSFENDPVPICMAAKTGDVIAFRKGLAARFEDPACTPNNWPTTPDEVKPFLLTYDLANDPRYVTLIITDITAFTGSGAENVPVKYFAGFYATGWDISPQTTGCPGENDPHPLLPPGYKLSKDNGDVWGHFVNIVVFSAGGRPNDPLCNFDEVGTCIAVLVE